MTEKSRLYPTIPTAPPDAIPDAESHRIMKVNEIQQFLWSELCKREDLYKKYKKGLNGLQLFDSICLSFAVCASGGSFGLLMTGVGVPIAIGLQSAGILAGILGALGKVGEWRVSLKMRKHDRIKGLALAKLNTIAEKVSKAYDDGCISDIEFKAINSEQMQYMLLKKEIQTKTRKAEATKPAEPREPTEPTEDQKNKILLDGLRNLLKDGKSQ